MFYVYILLCSDNTLYTGYTNDIAKRVRNHNNGKGAKYTKYRTPCNLVYYETYGTKSEAMKREWEIKHTMNRKDKIALINSDRNEYRK